MAAKLRATRCSATSGGGAHTDSFYFPPYFAADEAEVAAVLSRLPDLIRKFDSHRRFLPHWGARRKRSVVDAPPVSHSPANEKLEFASSSPTSPLAFSSHADLDSELLKKEDGEWLNDRRRSTESVDQLKGEVMKMELSDLSLDESMKLHVSRQLHNQSVCGVSDSLEVQLLSRSQPLANNHQTLGMMQVDPRGIPDLNAPAEEYAAGLDWPVPPQPTSDAEHHHMAVAAAAAAAAAEYRAGAAALARQRRHLIQKSKRATRGNRC